MVFGFRISSFATASLAAVLVFPVAAYAQEQSSEGSEPKAAEEQAAPKAAEGETEAPEADAPRAEELKVPVTAEAEAPAAAEGDAASQIKKDVEEILVTGSRIRRMDLTTAAPVTVLNKDDFANTGKVSIGDILQNLPANSGGTNTQVNNGGDGSTRASLRGLGSNRTLVLVNGRRHVPGGTGADNSVDLNAIPNAVIERIEVLKDGASAVYGSDAMGGVINIITRKDFQGAETSAYGGSTTHGDGEMVDLAATVGQASEKGNVVFSVGYYRQQPVWAGDRTYSRIDNDYDYDTKKVITTGSGTIPEGRIDASGLQGNKAWQDIYTSTQGGSFINDPTVGWRDFKATGVNAPQYGVAEGDFYNYQPDNYILTPQERYNVYSVGNYKLGESSRAYFEASYTNRKSEQLLASEPLMTSTEGVTVSKDNIYNPFGRDFTSMRRRLLEFGPRGYNQNIDTFRFVGGTDGTLDDRFGPAAGWYWDLSLNYGRTQGTNTKKGNLKIPKLKDAVGPSYIDADGTPRCGTPEEPIDGCVPLNLFDGVGSITEDMTQGLTFRGIQRGFSQQTAAQANVTGELIALPTSERAMALALGYEHRREMGADYPDPVTQAGETTGNKSVETSGMYDVDEGYAELSIPVINGVVGAEDVELTAAARAFHYSSFGSDWTWKLGARYKPISDVTLRGTLSTAFRAPSVGELFGGNADSFDSVTDPCNTFKGPIKDANIRDRCAAGVDNNKVKVAANMYDDRSQQRALTGGNPDLKPETADIITAGAVIEPSMVEGLSLTLDYYRVNIEQTIGAVGTSVILNSCYTTGEYCDRIYRAADGKLDWVNNAGTNVGSMFTDGWDITLKYDFGTEVGRFGLGFDTSWLWNYNQTLADKSVVEGRGNYDLELNPDLKFTSSVRWGLEDFGAGVAAHFVTGFKECENSDCSVKDARFRQVPSYATFDLFVSYALETDFGKSYVMAGVNNIADKDPLPIYSSLSRSDPNAYDFIGRWAYLRIAHEL